MGQAKRKKEKLKAAPAEARKLGSLSKDDLIACICVALQQRGYVPLLIVIPDKQVHPEEFERSNFSIYGGIRETDLQMNIFREVADAIEAKLGSGELPGEKTPWISSGN